MAGDLRAITGDDLAATGLCVGDGTFDHLTRLASRLLGVPVAMTTLVHGELQYLYSVEGRSAYLASRTKVPLRESFCRHVIETARPFTVDDAREHADMKAAPMIAQGGMVGYAGTPLSIEGANPIGSLCVFSDVPRRWSEDDLAVLRDIAKCVETEIRLRIATREVESDAQRRARASAELMRMVIDLAPLAIAMFDRDMRYLLVNRRWLADWGLGDVDLAGKSHYEVFPGLPDRWRAVHQRCLAGTVESAEEDTFLRADGRREWTRWAAFPWRDDHGEIGGIFMLTEVITHRKEAELAHHRAHERLNAVVQITRRFAESTGDYEKLLRSIADETGRFMGGLCFFWVVTEDRAHLDWVADSGADAAVARELRGVLGDRIPLTGRSPSVVAVLTGEAVFAPEMRAADWGNGLPQVLEVFTRHHARGVIAVPMRSKGVVLGTLSIMRFGESAQPLEEADVHLLQVLADHAAQALVSARSIDAVTRELEEHKRTRESLERAEEKLRQTAKMEAIGRLAGGIAHDFNNILTVILTYSEIISRQLRDSDPMCQSVLEIRRAGERASNLTRQLLAFSRQQVIAPRVANLNGVLAEVEPMLRRLLGEDIELTMLPSPDLWLCKVDTGQIDQVLMNLVVNARDAMPMGGKITIETHNTTFGEDYVKMHPEASVGDHVTIVVSDTGAGMDRAVLARIFEPFFTTKAVGVGTGLGLATVYGIVRQGGGSVWVYSEVGRGTTFKVHFPRDASGATKTPATPLPVRELSGTETVLVVEDEEQVRAVVRSILVGAGYEVVVASNAAEALLAFAKHGARIDLVLTDVIMPQMSGRQLVERLQQLRPDLRVLYMSGYTEDTVVHHGVLEAGIHYLQKPITPEALLRRVREVLA